MGKIIAARKEGKEEAGNAARKRTRRVSTPPRRPRPCVEAGPAAALEPPSSPSLGSVVAVGRQCLNVLVFLPELLFPARRERRAGGQGTDEVVVVKSQP